MNAIEFVKSIEKFYFKWLYTTNPGLFPRLSEFSTDVLGCWLTTSFPDETIELVNGECENWPHSWIVVNGRIVDFTLSQFHGGVNIEEDVRLSDHHFFVHYFQVYSPSPILSEEAAERYKSDEPALTQLMVQAKFFADQTEELGGVFSAFRVYLNHIVEKITTIRNAKR